VFSIVGQAPNDQQENPMTATHEPYLKAAATDRMAPFYDTMVRLWMREGHVKNRVLTLAELGPTVIGVDGDPTILGIARRKARKAGITAQFDEGMAYALPYPDASFDAAVSTLTFHHLTPDQQAAGSWLRT
jgi:SAM-dependent methyltransferase